MYQWLTFFVVKDGPKEQKEIEKDRDQEGERKKDRARSGKRRARDRGRVKNIHFYYVRTYMHPFRNYFSISKDRESGDRETQEAKSTRPGKRLKY